MAKPIASKETGAASALAAIERHELTCRQECDAALSAWKEARDKVVDGDDVSERKERRLSNVYRDALEMWHDALKKLAVFDKSVSPERREGEKASVADVKEWFRQLTLSLDLALEDAIIGLSQTAATCTAPEEFHKAGAEILRARKVAAIESACREGVLPKWITEL